MKALVFDGATANQTTASLLGASLTFHTFKSVVDHPTGDGYLSIIFDPCHMLKLMRNLLADLKELATPDGKLIRWDFIATLNDIQQSEGVHLANKLRSCHINFSQRKMKVCIAAQTLSNSVAKALTFLRCVLEDPRFAESSETSNFLQKVDRLFDRLNASSWRKKGFKTPLTLENLASAEEDIETILDYLCSLRLVESGVLLVNSRRRMAVLGE